ncbi:MAG: SLAC1 family transporter, partial [Nocardioides sp.]
MTTSYAVHPAAATRARAAERAARALVPGWFSTVMGTGIVASATATLPVHVPGLPALAAGLWALDAVLLGGLLTVAARQWRDHPVRARALLSDPVDGHFWGAPAMALMTVGAGAVLVGRPVLGDGLAIGLDAVLWTLGTALGLVTTVLVPWTQRSCYRVRDASATWLMPVVPPMVSAATGPLLLPHLPVAWRDPAGAALLGMFGLTLLAAAPVVVALLRRLRGYGALPSASVPTLWIVLGPLGQSVTAAHTLTVAGAGPAWWGLGYGLPVWGAALAWAAYAGRATWRAVRAG